MNRLERFRDLIAVSLLGALIALFFWKLLFTNLILARGDTFLYIYPYWTAAREALRSGRLPLWNPDLFMGAPLMANSQAGVLYPLNWLLWLVLDAPAAASLAIVLHLWLAAGFTYGFARSGLGLHRLPAGLAAVLYALGGYLTAQAEHVNQLQGLAWMPAVFWLLTSSKRPMRPLLLGVVLAVQVLAGHTQAVFITVVGATIYAVGQLWRGAGRRATAWRTFAHLILGGVLAVLLAAAQILPTLELSRHSVRAGGGLPLSEALSFSLHPLLAGRALLPGYGETIYSEYVTFLPLSALLLVLIGVWAGRRRPAVFGLALAGAAGLFFALGAANPIYALMVKVIPGFGLFRAPARWLVLYAFGAAVLAGVGLEALSARQPLSRRLLMVWTVLMLLLTGWALLAPRLTATFPAPAESPVEAPSTITLIGWGVEFLLALLVLPRRGGRVICLVALLVLLVSSRALPYNHLTAPEAYHALRPAPAQLLAAALDHADGGAPPGRFLSISDIFFDPGDTGELESIYADQLDPDALYDFIIATKHKEVLTPNLPLSFGVPAVDGYDGGVLPLAHYVTFEQLLLPEGQISPDGRLREYLDATPDGRWLNLLNVRFLITDKVGDAWSDRVYYDLQHSAVLDSDHPTAQVAYIPAFEATGMRLVLVRPDSPAGAALVDATARFAGGRVESHTLRNGVGSSLLRTEADGGVLEVVALAWSVAGTPESISITRHPDLAGGIQVRGLSLVDERDGTFQSLIVSSQGRYRLVHSGDVKIYENLDVLPRAFLVGQATWAEDDVAALERMQAEGFDPSREVVLIGSGTSPAQDQVATCPGEVTVDSYRPERVEMTVVAKSDGWLILSDAYYPGWEAEVDGQKVPIERADVLFRAVALASGRHHVVFSFRPTSVRIGLLISGIALALCLSTAMLLTARGRLRRRTAGQPQSHRSG
jgi:hypothetical protein